MTVGSKRPTGRLGTQLRGKLQKDYTRRGKSRYSLWYVYSPKAQRDFVLHGDLRYGGFLHAESDPAIRFVDYAPHDRVARIVGEELAALVDIELHLADGSTVWRSVRPSDSAVATADPLKNLRLLVEQRIHKDLPTRVEALTEREIYAKPQRIQNWNRLIPWLAQAREWPLHEVGSEVATLLHVRGDVLLQDVLALGDGEHQGLYVAALLHGVQFGQFRSDLDDRPWTPRSRFYVISTA